MALLSTPLKERVQTFLTESGAPPSADLTRNYEQICVAMQRRRGDDTFWPTFTELLRDLVDSVVKSKNPNASLPPEARLLALWDVNELAQLLRAALPHDPQPEPGVTEPSPATQWRQISRGISPNALGLLLLLGLAASACGSADSHTGTNNTGTTGGAVATGAAASSLFTGGKAGLGGASSSADAGGSSQSGGTSGLDGNGGTAGNAGGSASVGGAALGGTAATSGIGGSLITGGTIGLDSSAATSPVISGGMIGLGGNGGTVSTVAGGTLGLGGNGGTANGGSSDIGGTSGLGGNGGTTAHTGGNQATGGASLTCQRDAGTAGATAVVGHALPSSCCVDTASALWQAIDASTLDSTYKQTLYTCFVNLNTTWCDGLVDLFKTATPQVIANYLSDLVPCCQAMPSMLSVDFATLRQALINRTVCNVVLYKGVSFPTELES